MASIKKNVIILIILISIIIIPLIYSVPPNLPISVYGQVKDINNNPITNAKVIAIWKTTDANTHSSSTYTKTQENSKEAYYTFYGLDSRIDSEIIIESNNLKVSVISTPGIPIKAPDIIVPLEKTAIQKIISSINKLFNINDNPISNNNNIASVSSENISSSNAYQSDNDTNNDVNNSIENIESNKNNKTLVNLNYSDNKTFKNNQSYQDQKTSLKRAPVIEKFPEELLVCEDDIFNYEFNVDYPFQNLIFNVVKEENNPFKIKVIKNSPPIYKYSIYSEKLKKFQSKNSTSGSRDYELKFIVNDNEHMDQRKIRLKVIEKNHLPSIEDIKSTTLELSNEDRFKHEVKSTDIEDGTQKQGNLIFNLISSNNMLSINKNGIIDFIPISLNIGSNFVTICVKDKGISNPSPNISYCGSDQPLKSCDNFTLTVTDYNYPPEIISYQPKELFIRPTNITRLYFNVIKSDPDGNIPESYWYLDNILLKTSEDNSSDDLKFDYECSLSKNHSLTLKITDGKLIKSLQWNISIDKNECQKQLKEKRLLETTSKILKYIKILTIIVLIIIIILILNFVRMKLIMARIKLKGEK